jgi:hypothetical protein
MADDVKVKFGGDFTDLAKGAEDASKKAGTAMSGWVSDFSKSLKSSLANAFSLQNIAGTLYSKGRDQLRELADLDVLSKSLGISSTDLQKFAEMGKLAGLSQDQMGKAVQSANRLIAQAAVGNKGSQDELKRLGFTQKEVTAGQINALDIVYKLGDYYKQTGKEVVVAAHAQAVFGESGASMVNILRQGNDAIRDRIRLMSIYSEQAVRAGRRTNDLIERGEKIAYRETLGAAFGTLGGIEQTSKMRDLVSTTKGQLGLGTGGSEVQNVNPFSSELANLNNEQMRKFMDAFLKNAAAKGITSQEVADFFKNKSMNQVGEGNRLLSGRIASYAELSSTEEENLKRKQLGESRYLSGASPVLATSSLQSIGGGDIAGIQTGLYQMSALDAAKTTAEATTRTAAAVEKASTTPTTVQNKAK